VKKRINLIIEYEITLSWPENWFHKTQTSAKEKRIEGPKTIGGDAFKEGQNLESMNAPHYNVAI
jgi:hypothetical protein